MTLLDLRSPGVVTSSTAPGNTPATTAGPRPAVIAWGLAATALVGLIALSLVVGAGSLDDHLLWASRVPRTVAVVLSGAAMALGGLLMQLLVRNRFVEPSTVGTTESAAAGLLVATIWLPSLPVVGKMGFAVVTALLGTALFLRVIRSVPPQSAIVVVPLIGLMLSGVVSAATTFVAYHFDLLQTMTMWVTGDFSGVIRGRFELLWLVAVLLVVTYLFADRFTVAGLGKDHATGLGLNHRAVMALGLGIVAVSAAVCVVVVGGLPFLGLVVPNLVSMAMGDNLRRSLPVVCLGGAAFVLACDILARVLNHPYELPVGVIVGVIGAAGFLALLLRRKGLR
ncbi:ABC transporter permease [Granulicoccus sp. GXG6511]|uniref:ABC transporter permease n=1 Tax=Granulicoccus sp. GXG6511 TaxID=3381351 RepID=UPI003D7D11BC